MHLIAAAAEAETTGVGPGLLGFLVIMFLLVALLVLYRSLRKQIRRVDFDAEGRSDSERMRGHHETSD